MKRKLAAVSALALVVGVAGCATTEEKAPAVAGKALECKISADSLAKTVTVSGKKGEELQVKASLPDKAVSEQEVFLAEPGKGAKLVASEQAVYKFDIAVYDSKGKLVAKQPMETSFVKANGVPAWIQDAVACGKEDSRVVSVLPTKTIFPDPEKLGVPELAKQKNVIVVFDMQGMKRKLDPAKILKQAEGSKKQLPAGFPEITVDKDGKPEVQIPAGVERPTELKIADMVVGKGEKVRDGANVYVHYRGIMWSSGEEFDSSWSRGKYAEFETNKVIQGFTKALVGKKVGSRVVALVDPQSGYGKQWLTERNYEENDVMVFVIDILGVENPN